MTTKPRTSYAPRRTAAEIAEQKALEAAAKEAEAAAIQPARDAAVAKLRKAYAHRKSLDAAAVRADDTLTEAVRAARATGLTWEDLGGEVGMTRGNVVRKYTADELAGRIEAADPKVQDKALAKVRKAYEAREKANEAAINADEALSEVVYAARDVGVTYQVIADVLEMHQPGANAKYKRGYEEWRKAGGH